MPVEDKVILVGGFKEIIDLCEMCGKTIVGVIDNKISGDFNEYKLLGTDSNASDIYKEYNDIPLVITPDKPLSRKSLMQYYSSIGFSFASLIHPGAQVSKSVSFGKGVIIQTGVHISSNVSIGDFVKLNTYSNIMHDSEVGNFTTVAPNAVVLGRIKIGELCYIGANATILSDIQIAKGVMVGAGAVVTKNVSENKTVAGNPASILRTFRTRD